MADNDELSLGKGERLPWLEPVDDPAAEEPIDRHKIIGFAIAFFVALAVVAGSVWWFRTRQSEPNGTGALIAAPTTPYKVKPSEAGGMDVDGQGDATFAASEGAEAEGKLDLTAQPEAPVTDQRVADAGATSPVAASKKASAPVAVGGKLVPAKPIVPGPRPMTDAKTEDPSQGLIQLGAFGSDAAAKQAHAQMVRRYPQLAGLPRLISKTEVGGTTYFRLRLTAGAEAPQICAQLRAGGATCMMIK